MFRLVLALSFAILFAACARAPQPPAAADAAPVAADPHVIPPVHTQSATLAVELTVTASLSAERLKTHVSHLASDALEGRGSGTKGIHLAADYLEKAFRDSGLKPLFGDSYRQPFEMTTGTVYGKNNKLALEAPSKTSFKSLKDFEPLALSSSGEVNGELVFVGYGITANEHKYDDYAGVDVTDKIVVVLSGEPGDDDEKSPFDGKRSTSHSLLRTKVLRAREAKAKVVLIVREQLKHPKGHVDAEPDAGIIAHAITVKAATKLLGFDVLREGSLIDATNTPASKITKRRARVSADVTRERATVDNVGAILVAEGANTSTQSVVIGAHYDHLGLGGSASLSGGAKPEVHNGADDNASGTAAVLEAARALATSPAGLRRSVIFVLFAGEESGLLGSNYFVKNSPREVQSMAAMVNLDMVGRLRDEKLHVMGVKTGLQLPQLSRRIVKAHALNGTFGGDGYGPSDHTSFYASGIPVLFLFTGAHENYHKPSDDADTLNYVGLAKVGAIATDLVRALASAKDRVIYQSAPPPTMTRGGYGPYFGSIPEFGEGVNGLALAGVRAGSPAEKAGLAKGDVVTRFNGIQVKSIEDYTVALRACAPGDVVEIVFMRAGTEMKTKAKLERRQ